MFLPAEWSWKVLSLISLLILSVPLLPNIADTPGTAIAPGSYGAIDAAQLSRILVSLREIRHTVETSFDLPRPITVPTGLPVPGAVSSGFGLRLDPFSGYPEFHKGVDIAAARGTPVSAAADGTVLWSGWEGDYGKTVILKHPEGLATRYGHLDGILVRQGDRVRQGTVIGTVGDTGRATGPHLHFEVLRDGKRTNPKTYLLAGSAGGKEEGQ
jgi:murein DD-endopeptidase MepM/ murein hydrolase activator NlpD